MQIGIIGVNFKTSSLDHRERLAIKIDRLKYHQELCGCVVISTCNRIEIYFSQDNLANKHSLLIELLGAHLNEDFTQEFYTYFNYDCFYHLAKVTAGLDSAIFGESEIQRQIKKAYLDAKGRFDLAKSIHFLFQKALHIGKTIRSLGIEQTHKMTLEQTIDSIIHGTIPQFKNLLFIGNSQINRRIIHYFTNKFETPIYLASHKDPHLSGVYYLSRKEKLPLDDFQVIIAATTEEQFIINQHDVAKLKHKVLFFDLGLPRNIDPTISQQSNVQLFGLEYLHGHINRHANISYLIKKRYETVLYESVERLFSRYKEKQHQRHCIKSCLI